MRSSLVRSLPSTRFVSLAAAAALSASAAGCGSSAATPTGGDAGTTNTGTQVAATVTRDLTPVVASGDEAALVTGNSDFAFALYHGLSGTGGAGTTGNLFYSPYSVSLALAMTYTGAEGATASQIATALSFTLSEAKQNPAFDKLDLAIQAKPANATGADGAPFALNLADSLWGGSKGTFAQSYVNTLAANFGAGLRTVDFATDPTAAEAAINAWVANETDDKIDPLLSPGVITPDTAFVIVNAVYFNAAWATQFEKNVTVTAPFTRADGSVVKTPLMSSGSAASAYAKGSNYQAVELPYSGNTTSMVVILPDSGAYAAVESELSGSFFAGVTSALSGDYEINLTLPSFKIHGDSVSLVPELKSLGMVDAFVPKVANFDGMIPGGDVYIGDVIHQAFVDVDETGTEAAAATAVVGVTDVGIAVTNQVTVDVNHSFFFFIRDLATNTILFVGREDDPTAT